MTRCPPLLVLVIHFAPYTWDSVLLLDETGDNDEVVLKAQVPPCTTLWMSIKSIKLPVDCNDGPWRNKGHPPVVPPSITWMRCVDWTSLCSIKRRTCCQGCPKTPMLRTDIRRDAPASWLIESSRRGWWNALAWTRGRSCRLVLKGESDDG
ncbi:hypothetical protein BGY98DRAFT_144517 [Russula aff. rugulosa BPL654]|nr:hypothetical protein BGY98DRAFT_144517 [Russula aff. rugulosa BPL654]